MLTIIITDTAEHLYPAPTLRIEADQEEKCLRAMRFRWNRLVPRDHAEASKMVDRAEERLREVAGKLGLQYCGTCDFAKP